MVCKWVNDLVFGGRDLWLEFVSVEVEDIIVWNYSNVFVMMFEVWNLYIYVIGMDIVFFEELG